MVVGTDLAGGPHPHEVRHGGHPHHQSDHWCSCDHRLSLDVAGSDDESYTILLMDNGQWIMDK